MPATVAAANMPTMIVRQMLVIRRERSKRPTFVSIRLQSLIFPTGVAYCRSLFRQSAAFAAKSTVRENLNLAWGSTKGRRIFTERYLGLR